MLPLISIYAALVLVGYVGWTWYYERPHYAARGKASAWLGVRLSTIPIALATAALVIVPARSISGMEALAVAYFMLLIVGPIFWFGAHWLVGKLTHPSMTLGESAPIAVSPLACGIGAALLGHWLQGPAFLLLDALGLH